MFLETEISAQRLRPGDRIDEQDICRMLGVSRTPVREALLELGSLGYVSFRPRQGAVVARMSLKQIIAMWEVLVVLEGLCAEMAARRMPPEQRKQLASIHQRSRSFVDAGTAEGYDECNRELHQLLYDASHNHFLVQHIRDIRQRIQIYRGKPFNKSGRMQRSFDSHQRIVDAILAGDDTTANEAMRHHVHEGLSFLDFVAELPSEISDDEAEERDPGTSAKGGMKGSGPKPGATRGLARKRKRAALGRPRKSG